MNDKRISIFVGHFGSGKTEVAINYTLKTLKEKSKLSIIDLDIVNPYFRSREVRKLLEAKGATVLASAEGYEAADIPALSPGILGALQNPDYKVVFDVGGDNLGATALGRFRPNLHEGEYDLWLVVNPYRPFTRTPEAIETMLGEIEAASRLKVTGLISNPNLGPETNIDFILEGHDIVKEAGKRLNLAIKFLALKEEFLADVKQKLSREGLEGPKLFPIDIFMLPAWEDNPNAIITDSKTTMRPGLGRV